MATARFLTVRLPAILVPAAALLYADRQALLPAGVAHLVAGAAGSLVCLGTAWAGDGQGRRWRLFLGVGLAGWTLALLARLPGDAGSLLLSGFLLAALLTVATAIRRPEPTSVGRDRVVLLIDSVLITGSLLALVWSVLPGAVLDAIGDRRWPVWVAAAYPVADLVLCTMTMLLLATRPTPRSTRAPLRLLSVALLALGTADALRLVRFTGGEAHPLELAGYVLGPALIALAALTPPASAPEPPVAADPDWTHLLLPYVPVATTGVVIAIRTSAGGGLSPSEAYLGWVGLGLVVARQMFTIVDNTVLLGRVSEARRRLHHQAYHDPLTGLANRALFRDRLVRALQAQRSTGRAPALLFADLDDFKLINDSFGHAMGDRLLRAVGDRLLGCVPADDLVCRLGGDEFAVLIEHHAADAAAIGDRMLADLREPFVIDGHRMSVGASIGLVRPDPDDPELAGGIAAAADTLLRRADSAMYAGKRRGKGVVTSYSGSAPGRAPEDLPHLLAEALSGDPAAAGFQVHYQPVVRLTDGGTVGVEALARWTDPVAGPIDPQLFVTVAERTGLIAAIDDFVLNRACADTAELTRMYGRPLDLHVNVSAARLGQQGLDDAIVKALRRHLVRPAQLVVEITETRRIPDLTRAAAVVSRLRGYGVRVALDDFGSGFNELAQLHSLPVDVVKLDASLTDVDADPGRSGAMCRSVLAICAEMRVAVIAEGLETPSQARAMAALGCPLGQGYLFGAPVPLDQLPTPHLAS